MKEVLLYTVMTLVKIFIIFGAVLTVVAYLSYFERKLGGFIQDRLGPNRVGPWGLFQPIADGLKFVFKEDFAPVKADKLLYTLAPAIIMATAITGLAIIPFGPSIKIGNYEVKLIISNVDVGILLALALGGLSLYGIIIGGWASNNKYSLLGALRSASQLISYEITMALCVLASVLIYGSLSLYKITILETASIWKWGIFKQPLGFLLFLITAFAETNRVPFDLPEAEAELVAGYHTEYSGMKFAMFFMAEYTHMIIISAIMVSLYFGGWQIPFIPYEYLVQQIGSVVAFLLAVVSFSVKLGFFLFLFIWIRWTLPRFRFDQLLNLGWKVLLPLAFLNLVITSMVVAYA